jgi:hypothetical protein
MPTVSSSKSSHNNALAQPSLPELADVSALVAAGSELVGSLVCGLELWSVDSLVGSWVDVELPVGSFVVVDGAAVALVVLGSVALELPPEEGVAEVAPVAAVVVVVCELGEDDVDSLVRSLSSVPLFSGWQAAMASHTKNELCLRGEPMASVWRRLRG